MPLSERFSASVVKQESGRFVWFLPSRERVFFPFDSTNKNQVEARINKLLDTIDRVRGSETSESVLAQGIRNRRDDRLYQTALRQDIKTWKAEPKPENPYNKMLAMHNEVHAPPLQSYEGRRRAELEHQAEEWEAEQERLQEAEKLHSSRAYQSRLAEAQDRLIVSHYTDVSVGDLKMAQAMFSAAEAGDRDTYKTLHSQFTADAETRFANADKALLVEQQKIVDARQSLGKADFEYATEPEPVVPEPETTADESANNTNESENQ